MSCWNCKHQEQILRGKQLLKKFKTPIKFCVSPNYTETSDDNHNTLFKEFSHACAQSIMHWTIKQSDIPNLWVQILHRTNLIYEAGPTCFMQKRQSVSIFPSNFSQKSFWDHGTLNNLVFLPHLAARAFSLETRKMITVRKKASLNRRSVNTSHSAPVYTRYFSRVFCFTALPAYSTLLSHNI